MSPDWPIRRVPAIPELLVCLLLLLFGCSIISCSDETEVGIFVPLDSTSDTTAWLTEVRSASLNTDHPELQIPSLNALGAYYITEEHFDSALHYYNRARNISTQERLTHDQVFALEKISDCYLELQKKDSALNSMQEALRVSKAGNSEQDIALALQELGIFYLDERDSANALMYFSEEIKYDTLLQDSSALSRCYCNIATVYSQSDDYPRSIQSYQKAVVIAEKLENDTDIAAYNVNLGIVLRENASYDLALDHLLKAAPFLEKIHYAKELGSCYNSIGNIYLEINEPLKAIEYHMQALHLRDSIGYKRGVAGSLTNLGQAYVMLGQYDTAINYLNRSLIIKNELKDTQLIASSIDMLGEAYYHQKKFASAEEQYNTALELKSKGGDPKSISITLNKMGQLYHDWDKDEEALVHLRVARSHLEKIGAIKYLLDSYKIMTNVFLAQGNPDSAFFYNDLYLAMKDSVMNEQKQSAITENEVRYDSERKEQEIMVLNERNRADAATVSRQHTLIYSLIAVAALLIVLVFIVVRSRRLSLQQSQVIIEQKQTIIEQKQAMMGELHHRIKNNLQVLSSLLELQQSRIKDPAMAELMQEIDQRLTAMLLIHQGLYGNDIGSQVNMQNYIDALINNLCLSYGYSADSLRITKDISSVELDADKALSLGFICNEVISNWFKHALKLKDSAELHIKFTPHELRFSDNGPGIPPEKNNGNSGSFGLRLINLFSQELSATLQIRSDQHGTTTVLEIP